MSREPKAGGATVRRANSGSVETAPTLHKVVRPRPTGETGECPDENTIAGLIGGLLEPEELARLEEHLDDCSECAAVVNELGAVLTPAAGGPQVGATGPVAGATTGPATGSASMPESLGRYQVLEPLGTGGMGMVSLAYDPRLKRNVALKLIRPELLHSPGEPELRARLLREAQALASLSHPNVVAVHDVGEWEDGLFIAMEYVAGDTVSAWIRKASPGWRAIVDVYLQAGRGLAAAHGAGLVHRDVKPSNILLDSEGRARVTDFGLARAVEATEPREVVGGSDSVLAADPADAPGRRLALEATGPGSGVEHPDTDGSLTRTGAILGTPAYLSPEQHTGEAADERSDQFSFCVALYEALAGRRPFPGDSLAELARSVHRDPAVDRDLAGIPRAVRATLRRGLSARPADRFATLTELLEGLEDGLEGAVAVAASAPVDLGSAPAPPRQRPWLAVSLSAVALIGVLGLVLWVVFRPAPASRATRMGPAQPVAAVTMSGASASPSAAAGVLAPDAAAVLPPRPMASRRAVTSGLRPAGSLGSASQRSRPLARTSPAARVAWAKKRAAALQRVVHLQQQVIKLQGRGQGKRCLAALAELKRLAPATHKRLRYYQATCTMHAGRCQQGKRMLRAYLKTVSGQTPTTIAASVKGEAARRCPTHTLSATGRVAKLAPRLVTAMRSRATATCASLTREVLKLSPKVLKVGKRMDRYTLSTALYMGATCLGRGGRCSLARRAWILAQRMRLGGKIKGAQLTQVIDNTFRSSFPACAP